MKTIPMYQVDAFTTHLFAGNPAAVCILDSWPADAVLQSIAAENNLSETAFVCLGDPAEPCKLRWFTPAVEIALCGHATLATAHVLFRHLDWPSRRIQFATQSGILNVEQREDALSMDFPALPSTGIPAPANLCQMLGHAPVETLGGMDLLVILADEAEVATLQPDVSILKAQPYRGVVFSAPSQAYDFVSRAFYPGPGILEDPVTGSAHCQLTPYWAGRLGKSLLHARQVSARGGDLLCELSEDHARVRLQGQAITFLQGEIHLPD